YIQSLQRDNRFKYILFYKKGLSAGGINRSIFMHVTYAGAQFVYPSNFFKETGNNRVFRIGREVLWINLSRALCSIPIFSNNLILFYNQLRWIRMSEF